MNKKHFIKSNATYILMALPKVVQQLNLMNTLTGVILINITIHIPFATFYGIAIPAQELVQELERNGMQHEVDIFRTDFRRHANQILQNSLHYPPFEVTL